MKNENSFNDEIIIYLPICSKCDCEIKDLDLTLTFDCNCSKNEKELMEEQNGGCIYHGCRCPDCCDCDYNSYFKQINEDTSSLVLKTFNESRSLRHYFKIKPRSIIGEEGILINKVSSKQRKWTYHIFKFSNIFKSKHISDLYDTINFRQSSIKKDNINYNNNNILFHQAKEVIETIINSFFQNNIEIKEKIPIINLNKSNEKNILNEENINLLEKEITDVISPIKSYNEFLLFTKTFILDIICCLKILNKNPLFEKELKLFSAFNKLENRDFITYFKKYFEIRKEFEDNYNHKCIIEQMHIIPNKNLILLLTKYDIRIYDINDLNFNNCLCSTKIPYKNDTFNDIKIIMITEEFFILRKSELSFEREANTNYSHFINRNVEIFLLELQYNSSYRKKIGQLIINKIKHKIGIFDIDAFNKNNIICIDNKYIYFFNLQKTKMNLISMISINGNFPPYFILADILNQQIILLHSYEYNLLTYSIDNKCFNNKKINIIDKGTLIGYITDWSKNFKILNKNTYLLCINNIVNLISSKSLEIISIYNLEYDFDKFFILNNMNMLFFSYNNRIVIYKYESGDLIFYKKKYCKYYEKWIDIKATNDKGDHIMAIQKTIYKYKINLSRLYYNKYIDNLDYPFLFDNNINGYEDELNEFDNHNADEPYELDESYNSDESDKHDEDEDEESDRFGEIEEYDESEEFEESDGSNNDDMHAKFHKSEKESEFNNDKRNLLNKKIKKFKNMKMIKITIKIKIKECLN